MPISRYPEIELQLQMSSEILQQVKQSESQETDIEIKWFNNQLDLGNIELLYVYGLGLYLSEVEMWLKEKASRTLVILEDDLRVIDAFSKTSSQILNSSQVHLKFIPQVELWDQILEECASKFPYAHIQIVGSYSYAKKRSARLKSLRLSLQRKTVLWNALLSEELFAPSFHKNILENFSRLPKTFYVNKWRGAFKNVPAIICGAGPSLAKSQKLLREAKDKALIFAAGSAISAFGHLNLEPHFAIAVDPNSQEYEHLKHLKCKEVPFIFSSRLFSQVPELFSGSLGYLSSKTGGSLEAFLEEKLGLKEEAIGPDLGQEALSVTTLTASLAYALGCNPIIFVGVDLAYTGMQMYSPGVVKKSGIALESLKQEKRVTDQLIFRKNKDGHKIATLVKWVMESDTLSKYAKERPDRLFFDASQGGLGFKHIPYKNLSSILSECSFQNNLEQEINKKIQETKQIVSSEEICALFSSLKESLIRCLSLVEGILEEELESGKRVVLQMDLEEEMAYQICLAGPLLAFTLAKRSSFLDNAVAFEKAKWFYLKECIEQESAVLS